MHDFSAKIGGNSKCNWCKLTEYNYDLPSESFVNFLLGYLEWLIDCQTIEIAYFSQSNFSQSNILPYFTLSQIFMHISMHIYSRAFWPPFTMFPFFHLLYCLFKLVYLLVHCIQKHTQWIKTKPLNHCLWYQSSDHHARSKPEFKSLSHHLTDMVEGANKDLAKTDADSTYHNSPYYLHPSD